MRCLRPDYWVMRLSLLGLTSEGVDRVAEWIESTAPPSARPQVRSVVNRVRELQKSKNAPEETLCVNVTGGARQGPEMKEARQWIASGPFRGQFSEVEGPLIRATNGGSLLTHRPLKPGSTYAHLTRAIEDAYHLSEAMEEKDTELDLMGSDPRKPKFGNHWARRKSDKTARETMEQTGATAEDIDDQYGWRQKERRKVQQLHYSGTRELKAKARTSMML